MGIDRILYLEDLVDEPGVLENRYLIGNYRDYLEVEFRNIHGSELRDCQVLPVTDACMKGTAQAYVDKGMWRWQCEECGCSYFVSGRYHNGVCLTCLWPHGGNWAEVVLPENHRQIENLLLQMPGYRSRNHLRDWKPGWSERHLANRVERARHYVLAGTNPRKLSIAPTRTVSVGEIVYSDYWNDNLAEVIEDASGDNGPIEFRAAIRVGGYTTTERNALGTVPNGTIIWNETTSQWEHWNGTTWAPFVDKANATEAAARTLTDKFITPASLTSFLKWWQSDSISWDYDAAYAEITIPHQLGAVPVGGMISLVCTTATGGYSIGNEVDVWQAVGGQMDADREQSLVVTAASSTSLTFRINARNVSLFDSSVTREDEGILVKHSYQTSDSSLRVLRSSVQLREPSPSIDSQYPREFMVNYAARFIGESVFTTSLVRLRMDQSDGSQFGFVNNFINDGDGLGLALRFDNQNYSWMLDTMISLSSSSNWNFTQMTASGSEWTKELYNSLRSQSEVDMVKVNRNSPFVDWDNLRYQEYPFVIPARVGSGVVRVDPEQWNMRLTLWG